MAAMIAAAAANAFQCLARTVIQTPPGRQRCPDLACAPARVNRPRQPASSGAFCRPWFRASDTLVRGVTGGGRMKAVLCRAWGGPDCLRFEDAASPPLQP